MCIHHYYHHTPCGHMVKNLPLSVQHHCLDVEKALRFYHDQPSYHPLDQQLSNRYGVPVSRQLQTPCTCPEIPPPFVPDSEEQNRWIACYWSWVHDSLHDFYTYEQLNGQVPAVAMQKGLDAASEERRYMAAQIHCSKTGERAPTHGPYPPDQMDHIVELKARQENAFFQPDFNVIQHGVPWGCGRTNSPFCLFGHNAPQGPFCPYLLACRLPTTHLTPEAEIMGAFRSNNRGGAGNHSTRRTQGKEHIRSAPARMNPAGKLCPLPLSDNYIDAVMRVGQVALLGPTPVTSPVQTFPCTPSRSQALMPPQQPQPLHLTAAPSTAQPVPLHHIQQGAPPEVMSPDRWFFVVTGEMPASGSYPPQGFDTNHQQQQLPPPPPSQGVFPGGSAGPRGQQSSRSNILSRHAHPPS